MANKEFIPESDETFRARIARQKKWEDRTRELQRRHEPRFTGDIEGALKTLSVSIELGFTTDDTQPDNDAPTTITSLFALHGVADDAALEQEQFAQELANRAHTQGVTLYERVQKKPKDTITAEAVSFAKKQIERGIYTDFPDGKADLVPLEDVEIGNLPAQKVFTEHTISSSKKGFGPYDADVQMFPVPSREPDINQLGFIRHLASNDPLGHPESDIHDSQGEYAQKAKNQDNNQA